MVIQYTPEEVYNGVVVAVPMGRALQDRYPDLFTKVAPVYGGDDHLIAVGDKKLTAAAIWAGQEFPEMFTFKMLNGTIASLKDPSTAIISQSLATALFGKADPTGKTFKYENKLDFTIGGVYEDLPRNTDFFNMKLVLPWNNKENEYRNKNTARSERRAREVGIRKTVGSLKRQLIVQFLSESVLVSLLAFIFSIGLVELSLPCRGAAIHSYTPPRPSSQTSPAPWHVCP